jgi:hypothetical protein
MTLPLITALIEKNAFAHDTIITAHYYSKDLFGRNFHKQGDFKIKRILSNLDFPVLELHPVEDPRTAIQAHPSSIIAIDGMDVIRYADIYDLLPDGSSKKVGRKRGRKPKHSLSL